MSGQRYGYGAPSYYGYSQQPMPPRFNMGGYPPPSNWMDQMAYEMAMREEEREERQASGGQQPLEVNGSVPAIESLMGGYNPYADQPNYPSPAGMSPKGRFNDMVLRKSAELASRLNDGKAAVEGAKQDQTERQRLVDSITHPAPAAPYSISPTMTRSGMPGSVLNSRYGTGSVSFAPPGTDVHGTFGPDHLPFGNIGEGGPGAHEAQPSGGDPMQTTFQQQMIMDHINKALGRKR